VTGEPYIRFYAGCPLVMADGAKIGTLCIIDSRPRDIAVSDLDLLRDLAHMAEQELAALQLATIDELTGLSNRRGFEALATHGLRLCRRLGRPASLLYFDLDGFKAINDRFGHAAGDRALRDFGAMLLESFRDSDICGRIGGDEFVVLASDTGVDQLEQALARLGAAVARHNAGTREGCEIRFSVGITAFDPERHQGIEDLVGDADAGMYRQKRAKRASTD
jgi:diguanylate cyclase (GGDEF)-like protein